MNTDWTPALIQNARVTNNTIKNVGATGIWAEGGWNKRTGTEATYGVVKNVSILNNTIEGVTRFHGIRVSDAEEITIAHNRVSSVADAAFVSVTEYDGEQSNLIITDNQFSDCNKGGGLYPCVQFEKTTHDVIFRANRIKGSMHAYGVVVNSGSGRLQIIGNWIEKGLRGTVGDAGTNDVITEP
jgi:Right handed beta helix region